MRYINLRLLTYLLTYLLTVRACGGSYQEHRQWWHLLLIWTTYGALRCRHDAIRLFLPLTIPLPILSDIGHFRCSIDRRARAGNVPSWTRQA